ncbi:MAG: KdsC family phosphatase [Myxococcota bacterium]
MHSEPQFRSANVLGDPAADLELAETLRRVRLAAFDFDGVFTDNTVIVSESGTESVRCWRGDGLGLSMLRELGITTVAVSSETNPVVGMRCRKLGIACHQGCSDKLQTLSGLASEIGCGMEDVMFVGNDVNDNACLQAVGVPIVVADAHPEALSCADWTTRTPGGRGAVREICDLIRRAHEINDDDRRE